MSLNGLFKNAYNRRWNTVKELEVIIEKYFKDCIRDKRPFTVSGIGLALGTSRRTILNYQENYGRGFHALIKAAKTLCENYAEESLFTKSTVAGVIFNLKNNYRWIDEQTIKHSGLGELLKQINEEKEPPIKSTNTESGNDSGSTEDSLKKPGVASEPSVLD